MYPAAAVNGNVAPGTSTGDGIALVEKLAEQQLPGRMSYEWTELTFLEKQSRNTGALVFGLSVAFVFLVLAALYESWAFPLAVILVVPVCVACSLARGVDHRPQFGRATSLRAVERGPGRSRVAEAERLGRLRAAAVDRRRPDRGR